MNNTIIILGSPKIYCDPQKITELIKVLDRPYIITSVFPLSHIFSYSAHKLTRFTIETQVQRQFKRKKAFTKIATK